MYAGLSKIQQIFFACFRCEGKIKWFSRVKFAVKFNFSNFQTVLVKIKNKDEGYKFYGAACFALKERVGFFKIFSHGRQFIESV